MDTVILKHMTIKMKEGASMVVLLTTEPSLRP